MTYAIVMCDADGKITHWNDTAEEFFGHRRTSVLSESVEVIIPKEFREAHLDGLQRAMGGGERHLEGAATHLPVLHADGVIVCHPSRFNHITTAAGQLIAAVAVFGPAAPETEPWTPIDSVDSNE